MLRDQVPVLSAKMCDELLELGVFSRFPVAPRAELSVARHSALPEVRRAAPHAFIVFLDESSSSLAVQGREAESFKPHPRARDGFFLSPAIGAGGERELGRRQLKPVEDISRV